MIEIGRAVAAMDNGEPGEKYLSFFGGVWVYRERRNRSNIGRTALEALKGEKK
jgi:hypothetical protein